MISVMHQQPSPIPPNIEKEHKVASVRQINNARQNPVRHQAMHLSVKIKWLECAQTTNWHTKATVSVHPHWTFIDCMYVPFDANTYEV